MKVGFEKQPNYIITCFTFFTANIHQHNGSAATALCMYGQVNEGGYVHKQLFDQLLLFEIPLTTIVVGFWKFKKVVHPSGLQLRLGGRFAAAKQVF